MAIQYLGDNPDTIAIVSGSMGPGETTTEAEAMYLWLIQHGISPSRIVKEPEAHDTIRNLRYSFDIIDSFGVQNPKIAVLSNDFHLCRVRLISHLEGHKIFTVSAPTPYLYLRVTYQIREYFSLLKVWLTYLFI